MKFHKRKVLCILLTLVMLLSLAACGSSSQSAPAEPAKEEKAEAAPAEPAKEEQVEAPSEEKEAEPAEAEAEQEAAAGTATAEEAAEAAETVAVAEEIAAEVYKNRGFRLSVPAVYDGLLFTTTPEEEGTLFICTEIASIEAANAQGGADDHAGRLFSIQTIDEATLHEKLCCDMSGEEVFATDGNGTYFLLCHPTDVSIVRENYDNMEEELKQWSKLQRWVSTVPDTFIRENEGLTAAKYGNSTLDMYFAKIAFTDDVNYTISTLEYGPLEPKDVDPAPYLEKLWKDVTFEYVDEEAPDGEYVVLYFPEDELRFDFFLAEGKGNYIRQVYGDDMEYAPLFKAQYADESVSATKIMEEWYKALAEANGK